MCRKNFVILALCSVLGVCVGQIVQNGQCDPNIPLVEDFMFGRFIGTWNEIKRSESPEQTTECASFDIMVNNNTIIVNHSGINNNFQEDSTGTATLSSGLAKLVLDITLFDRPMDFWVLLTDYDNFAVTYSCENISSTQRSVYLWVLGREKSLNTELIIAHIATNLITLLDVDLNSLESIDHSDIACYVPVIEPGQAVILTGQCDPNIQVEQDFKVSNYTGVWYIVEAYPAPHQTGTCNKADYSLNNDNSLLIKKVQVVNKLLQIDNGSAIITTEDGSAKLDITFNIDGVNVTTNYWVLATNYESYALAYSCKNIDADFRAVFSWKLSRTPSLTAAANTVIDSVIDSIQVLHQQYYIKNSHTEEDCFYYPDSKGGDVLLAGQCLDASAVPAVTDFDANLFVGTWYEVSRFPSGIQQGECVTNEYTITNSNASTITHTNVHDERLLNITMQATIANDDIAIISINGVPFNNIFVLATDYNEYALVYSCRNIDEQTKQIYSWKLSRSRSDLSEAANTVINQIVDSNIDLWEGYYRTIGQDNDACFHYPIFDELPSFIELPGPCPDAIRGVSDFNVDAYLGRWFEVARYPNAEQIGQCSRTEYSLSDRLLVSNSEVAAKNLLLQSGSVDAAVDGSGQLNVEFVVDEDIKTTIYYILATDYTSYSLVYSCFNTDNGNRRVSSWKLSRTPSLSTEAADAMALVINNTQGLIEEYYQATSQTDEDCFYVPAIDHNQAVVFRGQCETMIGMEGFDAQRYLGWWHEIESYPTDSSDGDCRSSEYIQDGDTYRVVDTQVLNNEGTVITGTATIFSDGRLRRMLPDRPEEDIWILATDYDTYALLYSCQNINEEYKTVWSAKHSKTRVLTEAADNAMASVIANNRVLYEQFYIYVNQTDSVCFYYPTETVDQIIIPGQCDTTIHVVQNFNANDFAGNWYQIERYDQVGESTCVGSSLSMAENGSINVLNFEEDNGELVTIEGAARLVSGDGSAIIEITHPAGGSDDAPITVSLSILATDYASYALAYSCDNINAFQRQVRAWKLSRTRTLSTAGTVVIDNLIRQRQELHQPYFKEVVQNEECPEPNSTFIVTNTFIVLVACVIIQWLY